MGRYKPKNVRLDRARKAEQILLMVSREYLVSVEALRGNDRDRRIVRARREFCLRAKANGIGCIIAAKVLWRDHATVLFHQKPELQRRRQERYRAKRAARGARPAAVQYDDIVLIDGAGSLLTMHSNFHGENR